MLRRSKRRDVAKDQRPQLGPVIPIDSIYRDGAYLIGSWGEARTWAVHERGRWGVVYEWCGQQPVAGWVAPDQIPLEVRALALRRMEDVA